MLGQIWSALVRRTQSPQGVGSTQLEPIVRYRLALYVTTTTTGGSVQAPVLITSGGSAPRAN